MALDFPNSPTNGQVYTDAATGEQWIYDATTNSWTSKGLVNTSGGLAYKGDVDVTAAPPAGATSGSQYSVNPGGTANAGFGPGVTGTIAKGSMVMYTGTGWIETSHAVPDATPLVKGIDIEKWSRTGTTLAPATAGDDITTTGRMGAGTTVNLGVITAAASTSKNFAFSSDAQYGGHALIAADDAGGVVNAQVNAQNLSVWTATTGNPPAQRLNVSNQGVITIGNGTTNAVSLNPGTPASPLVRDSLGNVGIGTASPGAYGQLAVQGTGNLVNLNATSGKAVQGFFENTVGRFYLSTLGGSDGLAFRIGATNIERARISETGVFTIGDAGAAGTDPVAVSLDPGTTTAPLVRDSTGRVLVGTSSSRAVGTIAGRFQVEGATTAESSINVVNTGSNTSSSTLRFGKARGTGVVSDNDVLGSIAFCGHNGTDLNAPSAYVQAEVDGTPAAGSMPGRITFLTTSVGSTTPVERMRIKASGVVKLSQNFANKAAAGTGELGDLTLIGGALCFHDGADWKTVTLGAAPA